MRGPALPSASLHGIPGPLLKAKASQKRPQGGSFTLPALGAHGREGRKEPKCLLPTLFPPAPPRCPSSSEWNTVGGSTGVPEGVSIPLGCCSMYSLSASPIPGPRGPICTLCHSPLCLQLAKFRLNWTSSKPRSGEKWVHIEISPIKS